MDVFPLKASQLATTKTESHVQEYHCSLSNSECPQKQPHLFHFQDIGSSFTLGRDADPRTLDRAIMGFLSVNSQRIA